MIISVNWPRRLTQKCCGWVGFIRSAESTDAPLLQSTSASVKGTFLRRLHDEDGVTVDLVLRNESLVVYKTYPTQDDMPCLIQLQDEVLVEHSFADAASHNSALKRLHQRMCSMWKSGPHDVGKLASDSSFRFLYFFWVLLFYVEATISYAISHEWRQKASWKRVDMYAFLMMMLQVRLFHRMKGACHTIQLLETFCNEDGEWCQSFTIIAVWTLLRM